MCVCGGGAVVEGIRKLLGNIPFSMTFRRCLLDVMEMSWYLHVLQCPAIWYIVLQCTPMYSNVLHCPPIWSIFSKIPTNVVHIFFSTPKNILGHFQCESINVTISQSSKAGSPFASMKGKLFINNWVLFLIFLKFR